MAFGQALSGKQADKKGEKIGQTSATKPRARPMTRWRDKAGNSGSEGKSDGERPG